MKYRVFTNDVGLNKYSALTEITANSLAEAKKKTAKMHFFESKVLVIPNDKRSLWPDGLTGKVNREKIEPYLLIGVPR